jgi:hypothetical protein
LRDAWPRWMAAADVPDLTPARDQVFEHFYFAILEASSDAPAVAALRDGSLPPAVWPRPNSRPIYQQIAPNRRSIPDRAAAAGVGIHLYKVSAIRCRRERRAPQPPGGRRRRGIGRGGGVAGHTRCGRRMLVNQGDHASRGFVTATSPLQRRET